MEGNPQLAAHRHRITAIVFGPAFSRTVVGPVLHE
jgi:hypothetical protein